jgi:hypothetical protein
MVQALPDRILISAHGLKIAWEGVESRIPLSSESQKMGNSRSERQGAAQRRAKQFGSGMP